MVDSQEYLEPESIVLNSAEVPYQDLLRVPFKDGGRSPSEGFDCWGLVRFLLIRAGHKDVPDFPYRSACDPENNAVLLAQVAHNEARAATAEDIGAIVWLRIKRLGSHIGVIVAPGKFVHVDQKQGVIVERISSIRWRNRIMGIYRWPIIL